MSLTQGVYLGTHGGIEIKRANSGRATFAEIDPLDVNLASKRFSFTGSEQVITGDKLQISKLVVESDDDDEWDKSNNLTLVRGKDDEPSIERYAFKDMLGGIRLYETYKDAINGTFSEALQLEKSNKKQKVRIKVDADTVWNGLAKIVDWSFTSNRQAIDLTTLGDQFVRQYEAGLISGQGTLSAIWDDKQRFCNDLTGSPLDNDGRGYPSDGKPKMPVKKDDEVANYLTQLAIRVSIGAKFKGRFYIKYGGDRENVDPNQLAVLWEADCICTNVSMTFQPDLIVISRIAFITEGPFYLRMMDSDDLEILTTQGDTPARQATLELTTEDGRALVGRD